MQQPGLKSQKTKTFTTGLLIEDPQLGSGNHGGARSASLKKAQYRSGIPGASSSSFGNFGEPIVHRGTNVRSQS